MTQLTSGNDIDLDISTHTLTWSVTLNRKKISLGLLHFNSHAHVERDATLISYHPYKVNFNSHAHVERDSVPQKFNNRL